MTLQESGRGRAPCSQWPPILSVGFYLHCRLQAGPLLGALGGLLGAAAERVLDWVITAWDWVRAKWGGGWLRGGELGPAAAGHLWQLVGRRRLAVRGCCPTVGSRRQ